jgi:hypothetical protein
VKVVKYYRVSALQLFIMALLVGTIAASLVLINILVKEHLLLPKVILAPDGRCASVLNYQNGDAYTCADVNVILRRYRVERGQAPEGSK